MLSESQIDALRRTHANAKACYDAMLRSAAEHRRLVEHVYNAGQQPPNGDAAGWHRTTEQEIADKLGVDRRRVHQWRVEAPAPQ